MMLHLQPILDTLKNRQLLLVTAESLTGGLIAKHITDVPGASAVFWGGFVTYSIQAKQRVLSVPNETIERFGVVSIETAKAIWHSMLCPCRNRIGRSFRRYGRNPGGHGVYRLCRECGGTIRILRTGCLLRDAGRNPGANIYPCNANACTGVGSSISSLHPVIHRNQHPRRGM